jgi:hypothetical protein
MLHLGLAHLAATPQLQRMLHDTIFPLLDLLGRVNGQHLLLQGPLLALLYLTAWQLQLPWWAMVLLCS